MTVPASPPSSTARAKPTSTPPALWVAEETRLKSAAARRTPHRSPPPVAAATKRSPFVPVSSAAMFEPVTDKVEDTPV